MADVYKRLAKKLDEMPTGFPATKSGVELKILRRIFSPEDAAMALKLKPLPETAEEVAGRLGQPVEEVRVTLDGMAEKRQIGSMKMGGRQVYMLAPFVLGIYEFQLERLDKELVDMVEEYMPELAKGIGEKGPSMARVVPVNQPIKAELQVLRYEDMQRMIEEAKSFQLMDCICRKSMALLGKPCDHTLETCLVFSKDEGAFDYFSFAGRIISKEEALEVLDATEREGLIHCTYNVQEGQMFVCNCCVCCCGILRSVKEFDAPYALARSNFVAFINQDSCSACGACADERCQMEAIVEEDGTYTVLGERCIGCGVCILTCPTESISMVRRPEAERDVPPADLIHWSVNRVASRSGPLKRIMLRTWLCPGTTRRPQPRRSGQPIDTRIGTRAKEDHPRAGCTRGR